MPILKKMFVAFFVFFFISILSVDSFSRTSQDAAVGSVVLAMKRSLQLTDAQMKQVTSVVKEYFRQAQILRDEGSSGSALDRKIKQLRDDMDSSLKHYLTEKQMNLWQRQRAQSEYRAGQLKAQSTEEKQIRPNQMEIGVLESGFGEQTKSSGIW